MFRSRLIPNSGIVQKPAFEAGSAQARFVQALREYEESAGTTRQAWVIEGVIRCSRGLSENSARLAKKDRETLCVIRERYRAFAKGALPSQLVTFADAHALLRALFF